jgi:hypothetical protein
MSRAVKLSAAEAHAKDRFVRAVETLMLAMDAESVGRIADYVGENGTDGDGGAREDAIVFECLRVIVDNHGRR